MYYFIIAICILQCKLYMYTPSFIICTASATGHFETDMPKENKGKEKDLHASTNR